MNQVSPTFLDLLGTIAGRRMGKKEQAEVSSY